jgi:hypothetical protein
VQSLYDKLCSRFYRQISSVSSEVIGPCLEVMEDAEDNDPAVLNAINYAMGA